MATTVKLNIVIPSFNRDNLLAKCIGYLDKVFSRDNQNNGNIFIDTQVTVYRQFDPAVGPETVDIKTDNINVRIINRHKYKNFVFGNMLYDMAHDTDGVSQIPSIYDPDNFKFSMLLDDDAHYYDAEKSIKIFREVIETSINENVACIFICETFGNKMYRDIKKYPYQGMGCIYNTSLFDLKKLFSNEYCKVECSVDFMMTFKLWAMDHKVYCRGVRGVLDKDNNMPGGYHDSMVEKLNKNFSITRKYSVIHGLKRSAQHIYPDFFHYNSINNRKDRVRPDIKEYIKSNISFDDAGNIVRSVTDESIIMPFIEDGDMLKKDYDFNVSEVMSFIKQVSNA